MRLGPDVAVLKLAGGMRGDAETTDVGRGMTSTARRRRF